MNKRSKATASSSASGLDPASGREHLGTVLFGLWMTIGLFLDGYFHQNLDADVTSESFATPWHAVFYGGFIGSALWLATISRRRVRDGVAGLTLSGLPPGFDGARAGLVLFALGGFGDALWHGAFGVERGIDALLSPTHLLLFTGLFLMLTSPVRAARAAPDSPPRPWMLAASVIAATALVGFFLNFIWGLGIAALARTVYDPVSGVGETAVIAGVASMVVTTVVLCGAVRVLLAVGTPPPGAVAALFGVVALLVSVAFDEDAEGVAAALVAGVALDVALRAPSALARPSRRPVIFASAVLVLWLTYFGLLGALQGIEWQPEIWLGATVLNALAAIAVGAAAGASPRLADVDVPVPEFTRD